MAVILIAAFLAVFIAGKIADLNIRYVPGYEKIDLSGYPGIETGVFSGDDYEVIFRQTGLGKAAVDDIFHTARNPVGVLEDYQERFFDPPAYKCGSIGIVTSEERLYDEDGNITRGFVIEGVRDGDIFITKATHSVGWRHGHAAIVTDAAKGETLEAVLWGKPSMFQNVSKWRTYPTFIQLRLNDEKAAKEAAEFAKENLADIDYGLFTGLFSKKNGEINVTQCAHLPWRSYMQYGYDFDPNGGWLVTPKDITGSEYLEVVQIYGVDPAALWK